jgi:D-serine deaminase-like pyridoxal phosphate-dependent protein
MTSVLQAGSFESVDTPALLVDLDIAGKNIQSMASVASSLGVALRPHVKTHKLPQLTRLQVDAGAAGITVARLEEAEAMVAAGVRDVFLAYPIVDENHLRRARDIADATLRIAIEDLASAEWLDRELRGADPLDVMIEVDTGHRRCGVTSVDEARELARRIDQLRCLRLRGVFTHEGHAYQATTPGDRATVGRRAGTMLSEIAAAIEDDGIEVSTVSVGSSLTVESAGSQPGVTEVRPGTYVFNDRSQALHGRVSIDECAAVVLTTVIGAPTPDRVVVDAGSKSLALDPTLTNPPHVDFGHIVGRPGWAVTQLSEEHGMLRAAESGGGEPLRPGDRLLIVPNHICPVVNLFDQAVIHRSGELVDLWGTTGRSRHQWRRP